MLELDENGSAFAKPQQQLSHSVTPPDRLAHFLLNSSGLALQAVMWAFCVSVHPPTLVA